MNEESWFKDGLRFKCLKEKCDRNCCKVHAPDVIAGLVSPGASISNEEISRIAEAMSVPEFNFREQHVTAARGIQSLKIVNRACTFFDHDKGLCKIWLTFPDAVPSVCRSWYPFSKHTLASEMFWKSAGESCPGIGKGELFTEEQILQKLRDTAPTYYPDDPSFHERMAAEEFGFVEPGTNAEMFD